MFHSVDALMIRAPARQPGLDLPAWPDLSDADQARSWLDAVAAQPDFVDALEVASPDLAARLVQAAEMTGKDLVRLALAVMRYLLRADGRATPFGLFAGVAPARLTDGSAVVAGPAKRAVARVDAAWLTALIAQLEADPALAERLWVRASSTVVERDGQFVIDHRPARTGTVPEQVLVPATAPVRAALAAAADPIRLDDLAAKLSAEFPDVPAPTVDRLLGQLVAEQLLHTCLDPGMTRPDPLQHLLAELEATDADTLPSTRATVTGLRNIAACLTTHATTTSPKVAAEMRSEAAAEMTRLGPVSGPPLAVDLRVDLDVAVPNQVADEAARAAAALTRLARRPGLGTAWAAWHSRFLERFGPHALVPVRDAVDPAGLGYPAGFLGSAAVVEPTGITDRDRLLLTLAQDAARDRQLEVVLDDALIDQLTTVADTPFQPTSELTVRVHAATRAALDDGAFTLAVTGVSRSAGTTMGRFLHLADAATRSRIVGVYRSLPSLVDGALRVQVSAPPLYARTRAVASAPRVLETVLPVGEVADGEVVEVDDLAVTADRHRLYLLSLSRGRVVEPQVFNAVEPGRQMHPLARFLLQAPYALCAPCDGIDWGMATALPYLPALRYGRTVLSPARWHLPAGALPDKAATQQEWDHALAAWQQRVFLPLRVLAGEGDQGLPLDLEQASHRVLLRSMVPADGHLTLRIAPDPAELGWIDGRTHEIAIPLAATARQLPPPARLAARPASRKAASHPGHPGRLYLKLYGHSDLHHTVLTRHLPTLFNDLAAKTGGQTRVWFLRYHDPDPHLRLRLTYPPRLRESVHGVVTEWTTELLDTGLTGRVVWDTDLPEEGRYGSGPVLAAAEEFFAADSAAVLAQLAARHVDRVAVTAASLVDLTTGWHGTRAGMQWLIDHTRTTSDPPDRPLYQQAIRLAHPDQNAIGALTGGDRIIQAWTDRRRALTAYRDALTRPQPDGLVADLLHLHHIRMLGIAPELEATGLHLARAAALSWTARNPIGHP